MKANDKEGRMMEVMKKKSLRMFWRMFWKRLKEMVIELGGGYVPDVEGEKKFPNILWCLVAIGLHSLLLLLLGCFKWKIYLVSALFYIITSTIFWLSFRNSFDGEPMMGL